MKNFIIILFGFLILLSIPVFSFAQTNSAQSVSSQAMPVNDSVNIVPPQPDYKTMLPFGQNHTYTVTLRGNGEAIVSLKTVFSNKEEASLSAMKFTFQGEPKYLSVYQVFREPQCIRYKPVILPYETNPMVKPANDVLLERTDFVYRPQSQVCEEYQETDYQYGWGNTTYHKAKFSLNGKEVIVDLPKQVKPGGSGSLILAYNSPRITSRDLFDAFHFTFTTVQVNDTIQNLQVGIRTDSNYYLKDAKGDINYQVRESISAPAAATLDAGKGVSSAQFDQFYNQIGQGTVIKTATNLQPNESFMVKGDYADNKAKLYGKEITAGIGIVALVLFLAFGSLFIGIKKVFGKQIKPSENQQQPAVKNFAILAVLGFSFGSSLFILVYTVGLYLFSYYFSQMFQYYSFNFMYPMLLLLLGVISLSIYALFLFVPGIIIGLKKGIIAGVSTVILTVFWLIFYGIILTGIFFIFFQDKPTPYPYPPYAQPMGVMNGGASVESKDAQ